MGRKYEALVIFPGSMRDGDVEQAVAQVRDEISRQGGQVGRVDMLGKRDFARTMRKKKNGVYVRLDFEADPQSIAALRARLRLKENIFRTQIVHASEDPVIQKPADEETAEVGAKAGSGD